MRQDRIALWACVTAIAVGAVFTASVHAGLSAGRSGGPWNPVALLLELASGTTLMPPGGWLVAGCCGLGLVLAVFVPLAGWWTRRRPRTRADRKARLTGGKRASAAVRRKEVARKAAAFGLDSSAHPGYPIGRAVADRGQVYGDWESVGVCIAGPRTGKTSAIAIPLVLSAPGAVVATSNKRDLVDATLLARERAAGQKAWVFDPCGITKRPAEFFWNPLTFLTSEAYNSSIVARAMTLSKAFGDAARATGGRHERYDGFWDGGGDRIRSQLLAAAALERLDMHDVYRWVSRETDVEPVDILRSHGLASMADALQGAIDLPPDTKGGMWACARMGLGWIEDSALDVWWTKGPGRAEFDPTVFAQSRQSLYCLSADGASVTPLVSALTVATCLAAEFRAEATGGRLTTPMLVVLDEAANVCPWRDLPKLYSHFGSKGICLQTLLQSWSQGIDVWGETGMNKLWSAANTALYAGGVKEVDQLERISKLIGTTRPDQVSTSVSRDQRSTSITREAQERPIADVAELASLPTWRAWLLASGARPVLVELEPWFRTRFKDLVDESLSTYGTK